MPNHNERFDRGNKRVKGYIGRSQPLVWGSSHNDLFFVTGEENQRAARLTVGEKICIAGKSLTRLAALGTLSRGAGGGLQRISHKAPLPRRETGGTEPHGSARNAGRGQAQGLAGEGSAAFR